jgi:hypothetical protein
VELPVTRALLIVLALALLPLRGSADGITPSTARRLRGIATASLPTTCYTGDLVYDSTTKSTKECTSNTWTAVASGDVACTGCVNTTDILDGTIATADLANSTIKAWGTVNANTTFLFTDGDVQTITISGDHTYDASGMSATLGRTIMIKFTASGARTLAWDANWTWIGAKPSALADTVSGVLVLTNTSSTAASVIASWATLGTG